MQEVIDSRKQDDNEIAARCIYERELAYWRSLPEFSFRTFSQTIAPFGVQKSAMNSPVNARSLLRR
jgi:hypothetical protein